MTDVIQRERVHNGIRAGAHSAIPRSSLTATAGFRWRWRVGSRTLIACAFAAAAILRLVGLNWDEGTHLHPDERFLTSVVTDMRWPDNFADAYFAEATSTLNPRNTNHPFFVYGDLPVIAVKWVSVALHQAAYDEVYLVGRVLAAMADLGTLSVLVLLARRLYRDRRITALAALLYAFAALPIQQSHFFVVDNFSAFFAMAALYWMVRVTDGDRFRDYLITGVLMGLALASKVSVYPIGLVFGLVGIGQGYRLWRRGVDLDTSVERTLFRLISGGVCALVAFRLAEPYAFSGPGVLGIVPAQRWLANLLEARDWVNGDRDAPFAHQWAHRTPLLFPLWNMTVWGLGVPLGVAAWTAWVVASVQLVRGACGRHLTPVVWSGLLMLILGSQWVPSMRYFLPIYPTLTLLAAWGLIRLTDAAIDPSAWPRAVVRRLWDPERFRRVAIALVAVVAIGTVLYGSAFAGIYLRPNSRVAASRWIYANVPPGAAIANETPWDDALPLRVDGKDGFSGMFDTTSLNITDEESPTQLDGLLDTLDRSQYLFISSNRQYGSLVRIPSRFPVAVAYYQALFDGRLGFQQVAEFTSYPQILGIQLSDQSAEEAWTVYDHPRVQIFRKAATYSRDEARAAIGPIDWQSIQKLTAKEATRTHDGLELTPSEVASAHLDGTWSSLFSPDGLANQAPLAVWIVLLLCLPAAGWWALIVCGRLPDRGWSFVRPIGLLVVGWVTWWLASERALPFERAVIAVVFSGVVLLGLLLGWRRSAPIEDRASVWWRAAIVPELLFWAYFAIDIIIRWANPDLWHPVLGGEKPMDSAFLNAVTRTDYFPPQDPWFAGGSMNYYYFGFVLVGWLVKLTGVMPSIAYNLALPTLFAMTGVAAYGTTLALLEMTGLTARVRLGTAVAGSLFVAVLGNLAEVALVLGGLRQLGGGSEGGLLDSIGSIVRGAWAFAVARQDLPIRLEWWYWNASRVISHPPEEPGPINEMPFFTVLFGDLHAHLMALPFTIVLVGVAATILRDVHLPLARRLPGLCLAALLLGTLWVTNTWDVPAYAAVCVAALLIGARSSRGGWANLLRAPGEGVGLIAVAFLAFLPFQVHYASAVSGFAPWTGSRTPIGDFLLIHGLFLFVIASALVVDFATTPRLNPVARVFRAGLRRPESIPRLIRHRTRIHGHGAYVWGVRATLASLLVVAGVWRLGAEVPGLILLLLLLDGLLLFGRGERDSGRTMWQFALALFGIGLLLALGVEFFVLKDQDVGRMNTVFKFYFQVWVLWGVVAAAALAFLVRRLRPHRLRLAWAGAFTLLAIAAGSYPVLATRARVLDRFPGSTSTGLDGAAFMQSAQFAANGTTFSLSGDADAIDWLQEHAQGTPVIAEANTTPTLYGWGSRFAMFTGDVDVVGWDYHERQQRSVLPENVVGRRIADLQRAYRSTDPDEAATIFGNYHVDYIVVGDLERAYFPDGIDKFAEGDGRVWDLVYDGGSTVLYRMREPSLEN
jgi:YYY domain-containing protein